MKSLDVLGRLHRDGGLFIVTRDAAARPVAQTAIYPDGDLTTTVHPALGDADRARHQAAVDTQLRALSKARRDLVGYLTTLGAGAGVLASGLAIDDAWMSGGGATAVLGLLGAAWRFRRTARRMRTDREARVTIA